MRDTSLTVNVHINDETTFEAQKISDFVTLRVGSEVDLFLFDPEQALKLYKAVGAAFIILHTVVAQNEAIDLIEKERLEV